MHYNRFRQLPDLAPKVHAEIAALSKIRHLDIDWNRIEVYVYRACKNREHGMARPCRACMQAIIDLGIRTIYYSTDAGFVREDITKELIV